MCSGERPHCTSYAAVDPVFYWYIWGVSELDYEFQVRAWYELGPGPWSEVKATTIPSKAPEWISVKTVDAD